MNRHVYATVADFRRYIESGTTSVQDDDSLVLTFLESASRKIDGFLARSLFGSGFGPRVGVNRYDAGRTDYLGLNDDLLTATEVATLGDTGGTETVLVVDDEYYLQPYDSPRKRTLQTILGMTLPTYGQRVIEITGTWGYADERVVLGVTESGALTASGTTLTTSAAHGLSPGHTLLIDSEQMLVTVIPSTANPTTATVVRGVNGTTAATHDNLDAISRYTYDSEVVAATLQIAQRRWKSRQAGVPIDAFGGQGATPVVSGQGGEGSILYNTVGHLRLPAVG